MYEPKIYLLSSYLFSYLSTYVWDLFPVELVTKVKPNINWDEGVEVHPQPSNNGHPMDGWCAGGCWFTVAGPPYFSMSKINTRCAVCASEWWSSPRRHVLRSIGVFETCPHPTKALLHRQIRIIIVAPEAHFHEPFFASLDLDVRSIFSESHPEHRWEWSSHLAWHLQNRSLSLSLYRSFACNFGR